jgi:hypothetical protein
VAKHVDPRHPAEVGLRAWITDIGQCESLVINSPKNLKVRGYPDWLLNLSEHTNLLGAKPVRSHLIHALVQLGRDHISVSLRGAVVRKVVFLYLGPHGTRKKPSTQHVQGGLHSINDPGFGTIVRFSHGSQLIDQGGSDGGN